MERIVVKSSLNEMLDTANIINEIVDTMSKEDKESLGLINEKYQTTLEEGEQLVKRFIKIVDDIPVSFCDLFKYENNSLLFVSIGTRSGKWRGKGYALELAKEAKKWIVNHGSDYSSVAWWVKAENIASIKIAKSIGFVLDESSKSDKDTFMKYYYQEGMIMLDDINGLMS